MLVILKRFVPIRFRGIFYGPVARFRKIFWRLKLYFYVGIGIDQRIVELEFN